MSTPICLSCGHGEDRCQCELNFAHGNPYSRNYYDEEFEEKNYGEVYPDDRIDMEGEKIR